MLYNGVHATVDKTNTELKYLFILFIKAIMLTIYSSNMLFIYR